MKCPLFFLPKNSYTKLVKTNEKVGIDMKKKLTKREYIRRKRRRKRIKQITFLLSLCFFFCGAVLLVKAISDKEKNVDAVQSDVHMPSNTVMGETQSEKPNEKTNDQNIDDTVITPEPTQESTSGPIQLTISAAGNCTLGTDENFDQSTSFNAKYNAVEDPSYFFREVKSAFETDDLTIVNFEGTLTTRGERKDKTYAFRGKPEYTAILTSGSVEAVNLANNHSFDYGNDSYEDTKKYLTEAGIISFGYDRNAVIDVKGVKVGLIGIYELPYGLESANLLRENIATVKSEGAQLIIVSFHWGTEKENYPDSIQKELAHIAIDEGAHLVLGHHPHVLQEIEEYKGRNIVYSLGNFCFGGNKNPSDKDTMIFQQTFTITNDVVSEDNVKNIIPCSLSSRSDHNNYQPMILDGEEKERVMNRILTYSENL